MSAPDPLGICVIYEFEGDETQWNAVISGFIAHIQADEALKGQFSYTVQKAREGSQRIHIGRWDAPETVALLQSRDYFKSFSADLKELAGDTLSPVPFSLIYAT